VNLKIALFVCIGFVVGSFLGANIVTGIPDGVMKKAFGVVLAVVAVKYLFF
jgi:uncharacterized protein